LAIGDGDEGRALFTEHRQSGRQFWHSWSREQQRIRHIEAEDARKTDQRRSIANRIGPDS